MGHKDQFQKFRFLSAKDFWNKLFLRFWTLKSILKAPSCPNDKIIRLVKSSPYNSDLRRYIRSHMKNQGASNAEVFFLIGLTDPLDKEIVVWMIVVIDRGPRTVLGNLCPYDIYIFRRLKRGGASCNEKWSNSMILSSVTMSIHIEI